jgi:hypothetical protein
MKKHFWSVLMVSVALAGCASGVKLDDVPVEDKSATSKTDVSKSGIQVTSNTAPSVMSADRLHALLRIITAIRNAWSAAEMDILNAPLKTEAEK